jgi:S1-C subfamily serine protease
VVVGSVVGGILGAALMVGSLVAMGTLGDDEAPAAPPTTVQPSVIEVTEIVTADGGPTTAAAVGRKVVPSIVTVETGITAGDGSFDAFAKGSGVVLTESGEIVTNDHVIQGAEEIRVVLQNGRIYPAQLRGSDVLTDLAVVTVDAADLRPIELGTTTGLVIGDTAIAVGNPLGLQGGASLTVGVVSAFDREVTVAEGAGGRLYGMLQTDAPITRGSSGGALVDAQGRLIGITTAIGVSDAGAEGIGFAIPVELMTRIIDEIIESGGVRHAFLGVSLQNDFEDQNGSMVPAGAAITSIEPDTGADAASLVVGDRIIFIDTNPIVTGEDVVNGLRRYRVGDTVKLTVVRGDETLVVDVVLGERPEDLP